MIFYVYIYTVTIGSRRVTVGMSYREAQAICRRLNSEITNEQTEHYFVGE